MRKYYKVELTIVNIWWYKEMNIAGATFDNEEVEEIEDIVKVSLIARRIKNLPNQKKAQINRRKPALEVLKKTYEQNDFKQGKFSLFSARGLI
ncbi:MAG: hypothetical protein JSW60_02715 [Thermoplasmatales archaeon]|nr:MAG: hypothetical protein JSW60_02715 [Thermoplasmatales archaeon]